MKKLTVEELQALLVKHDDGVLKTGNHRAGDRAFCAMEFVALVAGEPWTDNPQCVHPALAAYCRKLNDARWPSDVDRTRVMLPLIAEVFGTRDLKISVARIAHEHIRQILPIALEAAASIHPQQVHKDALVASAKVCRESAAESAAASAAESAARSAESAARSAESAARSAARSAESAESAASAAESAARSAESAARSAESAARSAAKSAARSAESAESAAWSAASAAWSAARSAESAAWSAAILGTYQVCVNILVTEIKRARKEMADANA